MIDKTVVNKNENEYTVRTDIFEFIKGFCQHYGYAPSFRQIGNAVNIKSLGSIHDHISIMVDLGLLKHQPNKPRSLEVVVK